MRKSLLILVCLFLYTQTNAQKRANHWFFGENAGLEFSKTGVQARSDGMLSSAEGCATISDVNGNLLFYTNGETVYNADHGVMTNGTGLTGNNSAAQSSIILPKPGSKTLYYLFTVDQSGGGYGLSYSVIDITQAGGLGAVTSTKNINLLGSCAERLTAIRSENGASYWVITHGIGDNKFYAFNLNANGVNSTPVISSVGTNLSQFDPGQLKGSPDGKYLVMAAAISGKFAEVYDFDASTGEVNSALAKITYSGFSAMPYGVEFSADIKFLYVAAGGSGVFQYDMDMIVNQNLFQGSEIQVNSNSYVRSLQLGPDGKIYGAKLNSYYLDVIQKPKAAGLNCSYDVNGIQIGSNFRRSKAGLPNFLVNYLIERKIEVQDTCIGDSTSFTYLLEIPDSCYWDFGDPNSGTENHSNVLRSKHVFSSPGTYSVTLYVSNNEVIDTFHKVVKIHDYPNFTLGRDTTICEGATLLLQPNVYQANYRWQDGRAIPVYLANKTGSYHVRVEKYGCASYDTIEVTVHKTDLEIKMDRYTACENDNYFVAKFLQGSTVTDQEWDFGDGTISKQRTPAHTYSQAGDYTIKIKTVNNFGCEAEDQVNVNVNPVLEPIFTINQTEQCLDGNAFEVKAQLSDPSILKELNYSVSDGSSHTQSDFTHHFQIEGNYSIELITVTMTGCRDTAIQEVEVLKNPEATFFMDIHAHCELDNLIHVESNAKAYNGGTNYEVFRDGEGNEYFKDNVNLNYKVPGEKLIELQVVDKRGCSSSSTKKVTIHPSPKVGFTTAGQSNCVGTDPITFSNTTTISNGLLDEYHWDFGDGTDSRDKDPSKQYPVADEYNVKLWAISDQGCEASINRIVSAFAVPEADFVIHNFEPCEKDARIDLANASTIKGNDNMSFTWNLDGKTFTDKDIIGYQFTGTGQRVISLKVVSDKGCESSIFKQVEILPSPKASFTVNDAIQCENNNWFVMESTSSTDVTFMRWDLSNGLSSNGAKKMSFSMDQAGTVDVQLTVQNDAGCEAVNKATVESVTVPQADFSTPLICAGSPVGFTDITGGNAKSWDWAFGSYGTSKEQNPDFTFEEAGKVNVFLSVKTIEGCETSVIKEVNVKASPTADFKHYKYGYEDGKTIIEGVEMASQDAISFQWNLNGNYVGKGNKYFFSFTDTGHYNIGLKVTNKEGCSSDVNRQIFVLPPAQIFIPNAFSPNGDGLNEYFAPVGMEYLVEYEMIIMNHWGTVVFQSKDLLNQWDGTFRGVEAPVGSYMYVIRAKDLEGKEHKLEGAVALIR